MAVPAALFRLTDLLIRTASGHVVYGLRCAMALDVVKAKGCRIPTLDDDSTELESVIQFQDDRFLLFFILLVHSVPPSFCSI
jgi:hypothetical protein